MSGIFDLCLFSAFASVASLVAFAGAFLVAFLVVFLAEISVLSDFGLNLISVGYLADIRSQT